MLISSEKTLLQSTYFHSSCTQESGCHRRGFNLGGNLHKLVLSSQTTVSIPGYPGITLIEDASPCLQPQKHQEEYPEGPIFIN